jgi:hypothetical protein
VIPPYCRTCCMASKSLFCSYLSLCYVPCDFLEFSKLLILQKDLFRSHLSIIIFFEGLLICICEKYFILNLKYDFLCECSDNHKIFFCCVKDSLLCGVTVQLYTSYQFRLVLALIVDMILRIEDKFVQKIDAASTLLSDKTLT